METLAFRRASALVWQSHIPLTSNYRVRDLIADHKIHFTKQRKAENMSRRRQMVTALVQLAAEQEPNLAVLGMSATQVINNLQEGRSLIELVTGVATRTRARRSVNRDTRDDP